MNGRGRGQEESVDAVAVAPAVHAPWSPRVTCAEIARDKALSRRAHDWIYWIYKYIVKPPWQLGGRVASASRPARADSK